MVATLDISVFADAGAFARQNGNSMISGRANAGAIVNSGGRGHYKSINVSVVHTTLLSFSLRLDSD